MDDQKQNLIEMEEIPLNDSYSDFIPSSSPSILDRIISLISRFNRYLKIKVNQIKDQIGNHFF